MQHTLHGNLGNPPKSMQGGSPGGPPKSLQGVSPNPHPEGGASGTGTLSPCQSPCHQCNPSSPAEFQLPVTEPDINNRLESLCLSMTEHALGGECILLAWHGTPGRTTGQEGTGWGRQGTGGERPWGAVGPLSSHTIHSTRRHTQRAPAPCSCSSSGGDSGPRRARCSSFPRGPTPNPRTFTSL